MSTLSFDNLSSEHLGYWSPIKLKLTPTTIHFKNEKTGKTGHFEGKTITSAEWIYRARGFGLCTKLNSKKRHYFDGFADGEFDKVSKYFEENYGIKVKNVETCLKGWNWGKPQFEGEYMEFLVDGMRCFDINLKDVINANLNKNELTIQFQTSDEAFSIYEMRFATVSTNENVMIDMLKNVQKEANIIAADADAIVSLREIHCLQPRGRYEIKLCSQYVHLRGKTYDYSLPKLNFVRFYLLPHPDERQIFFVLQVNPPLTHGQTRYHFIILLFNNEDEISVDLNLSEEALEKNYGGSLSSNMSGLTFEVVTKLFKSLYDQKLTVPNKFESKAKARALTCTYKTTSGFLYPLDKGFIFVPKPAVSIRSDEITCVNLLRASMMQRTFDFDIETSNGATHTFNSIDKAEYPGFLDFIKAKKYVLSSGESTARQEDWSSSGESHDGYLERMKEEGKRNRARDTASKGAGGSGTAYGDDDDDDEDDEDFNPEEVGESDVAEEYDSSFNASSSSSGSSDSDDDAGAAVTTATRPSGNASGSTDERPPAKSKESIKRHEAPPPAKPPKGAAPSSSADKRPKKRPAEKTSKSGPTAAGGGGGGTSGTGKKKKAKDPNAPKKPLTAYILFSNDVRDEVKRTLPPGSSIGEVAKAIGERWKTVTDAEKTKYANQYKLEHEKYLDAMKQYERKKAGQASTGGGGSGGHGGDAAHKGGSSKKMGEIVGKLSGGAFKSEEFVESSEDSD